MVMPALWVRCTAWRRFRRARPVRWKSAASMTTSRPNGIARIDRPTAAASHSANRRSLQPSTAIRQPRSRHIETKLAATEPNSRSSPIGSPLTTANPITVRYASAARRLSLKW
ncbi:hypothetical protein EU78_21945 [Mycolicibacterium rufum]|nr:hypothetical protein EU78_21945 [Mycolicibacterium rufum]